MKIHPLANGRIMSASLTAAIGGVSMKIRPYWPQIGDESLKRRVVDNLGRIVRPAAGRQDIEAGKTPRWMTSSGVRARLPRR